MLLARERAGLSPLISMAESAFIFALVLNNIAYTMLGNLSMIQRQCDRLNNLITRAGYYPVRLDAELAD